MALQPRLMTKETFQAISNLVKSPNVTKPQLEKMVEKLEKAKDNETKVKDHNYKLLEKVLKEANKKLNPEEDEAQALYGWNAVNPGMMTPEFVPEGTPLKNVLVKPEQLRGMQGETFKQYRKANSEKWKEEQRMHELKVSKEAQTAELLKIQNDMEANKQKQDEQQNLKLKRELAKEEEKLKLLIKAGEKAIAEEEKEKEREKKRKEKAKAKKAKGKGKTAMKTKPVNMKGMKLAKFHLKQHKAMLKKVQKGLKAMKKK